MNYKNISLFILLVGFSNSLFAQKLSVKIHIKGVYDSKIAVLSLAGPGIKTLKEYPAIKSGDTAVLEFEEDLLPGAFVLRFDYKENEDSSPYPSEKQVFIGKQSIELWVNPLHINNPDSTYFQEGEKENTIFEAFSRENYKRRETLGAIQNLLASYDQQNSTMYKNALEEYEQRRKEYNQWLKAKSDEYKGVFVSHFFILQYLTYVDWKGKEEDRVKSIIENYFEGMDFKDPVLTKTSELNEWMNNYVNLYGSLATTIELRDSLFTLAGHRAIEKAKEGDPLLYGWMVDYFYNGYESFNIQSGFQMLQPYLNDPLCLTQKRQAIETRLEGMQTMVVGGVAPDFDIHYVTGRTVQFHYYEGEAPYKLVLFWSAECGHCLDLVDKLYPWYKRNKDTVDIFALSLDQTETEVNAWEKARANLLDWTHKRTEGGVNSAEANAYYILSTPVMILVDAKSNEIVALPEDIDQLNDVINN